MVSPTGALGERGTATIEFAIIAPVMMVLFLGTAEFANVARIQAHLNTATGAIANFVAADNAVTAPNGTLADKCVGAARDFLPYSNGSLAVDIVSGTIDHPSNRVAGSTDNVSVTWYVDWENISSCPTAYSSLGLLPTFLLLNSPNSMYTKSGAPALSTADLAYKYSAILVRTKYVYNNVSSYLLPSSITLTATAIARPRSNAAITCTNVAGTTPCPTLQ